MMILRILPVAVCSLLYVGSLLVINIGDVESSYGDTCTQNDTFNCTFPVLNCTPAGRCDCYLGFIGNGSSENDTICSTRSLSVPLISTTITPTTVIFRWEASSPEEYVHYGLEWTPRDGQVDYIETEEGQVSGLQSDQAYNFTIVTDLDTTVFHPGGKFFGEIISICTTSLYEEECSTCGNCHNHDLACVDAKDDNSRCLCADAFFNLTETGNCSSLNTLVATSITSTSTTTEITLHWVTHTELSYVTYQVEWSPPEGGLYSFTRTGATVSQLSSGTIYDFSIIAVVPGDAYNKEKRATSQEYMASTRHAYLSECDFEISDPCQETTECVETVDGIFTCLCGGTEYFSSTAERCSNLEDLKVADVAKKVTASTVTFTWSTKVQYVAVNYKLEWIPRDGTLDNISSTGAHVSGLITDTMYNFTITSSLPADAYYLEKSVSVQVNSVMTENDLEVNLTSTTVSATSVTFTWIGSSLKEVDYSVRWTPGDGSKDVFNSSGGHVSDLRPDSQYNFTIVSEYFVDDPVPERVFFGPNITICTESRYGGECSLCHKCENDKENCVEALDETERCLCGDSFFNLTDTGNCTSFIELRVSQINTTASTTGVNISWVPGLQASSVTYRIDLDHSAGEVDSVTRTGARVSALSPGKQYNFFVNSVATGDFFNSERVLSSQSIPFWTDALYLGMCDPSAQRECQEMTECIITEYAYYYYCLCDDGFYFNKMKEACYSMNDLKVTNVSTTTTSTTASFTWAPKHLPSSAYYTLIWSPVGGARLDSVGQTGAHISGLNSSTSYNFTIITILPADPYYSERRAAIQIDFVKTKPSFNETCDLEDGCQDFQHCLDISGSRRCLCRSPDEVYDSPSQRCLSTNDLEVSLISTTISATTVTFRWIEDESGSDVDYNLEWTPKDGQMEYVHSSGGLVSGLLPNILYNFTISGETTDHTKSYYGPNVTVCTKSLYGGECLTCGSCQDDHQSCVKSLDNNTRCLCGDLFFNFTETGNCTSLNNLIVTNITTSRSTTSANISWVANLQVSSETYKILLIPNIGHTSNVTSTGSQVLNLLSNNNYYFSVESSLPGDRYENGKSVSSTEIGFYTDVDYLGYCDIATNQECQEMTKCNWAEDNTFRCVCDWEFYFNNSTKVCSPWCSYNSSAFTEVDDLKVTNVSATTTATTITLTWPDKQLPTTGRLNLEWVPNVGRLDNISSKGAHVNGLTRGTVYNFTITSLLPSDQYYPERSTSVLVPLVLTKFLFGERCSTVGSCQDDHQDCLKALDDSNRCLCVDSFFNLTETGNCTSLDMLKVTNITVSTSTTTLSMTWIPGVHLSSITYQIRLIPKSGHIDFVNSTGCQVSGLSPGNDITAYVESDLPRNAYQSGRSATTAEIPFSTDVPYLGYCNPDKKKECTEMTECKQAVDGFNHCICGAEFYFNNATQDCSSLDDLKVTDVTTTTTDTAVTFTWPEKQFPPGGSFDVEWFPAAGGLDSMSSTGARVVNLTTGAVYNFTIVSTLAPDSYYPEKSVSVQISSVTIKNQYAVSHLSTSVSATGVTFLWQGDSPDSGVGYNIEWTPKDGKLDFITISGGQISGLLPDSRYNITIESELSGESFYPDVVYRGPNLTICTKSLLGGQCSTCGSCEDDYQSCTMAEDKIQRCLCGDYSFNLTETGNCTSLNRLVVSSINITSLTTSAVITWSSSVQVTTEVFRIQLSPVAGQVHNVTSTGGQVSGLTPGTKYSLYVQSVLPQNEYVNEKMVSSPEYSFWTEVPYLGLCPPFSNKKCQNPKVCVQALDDNYRCLCDPGTSYFNTKMNACSSLNDLAVSQVSATTTATTVTLTWLDNHPMNGTFDLGWLPGFGFLQSINRTGAVVFGMNAATLYNFTIDFNLHGDVYYDVRRVSVEFDAVMTKIDYHNCSVIAGKFICQCDSSNDYFDVPSSHCMSKPSLNERCDISIGCQDSYPCLDTPPVCRCKSTNDYFDDDSYQCMPLSSLAVGLTTTEVTATTVTFMWIYDNPDSGSTYDIQWTPHDGHLNYTDMDGGEVTGLQPGTQYNFTIVSVISDYPYSDKKYFGPNVTLSTSDEHSVTGVSSATTAAATKRTTTFITEKPSLNESCNKSIGCKDPYPCMGNPPVCQCASPDDYFDSFFDQCLPIKSLAVSITKTAITATTVTFSWEDHDLYSGASFDIQWTPHDGHLNYTNSVGGQVIGLQPGTKYNFTIVSILSRDPYTDNKYFGPNVTLSTLDKHNVTGVSSATTAAITTAAATTTITAAATTTATITAAATTSSTKINENSVTDTSLSTITSSTSTTVTTATASTTSTTATASNTGNTAAMEGSAPSQGLGVGDRVGIGIGSVVLVIIVIAAVVVVHRRRVRMLTRLQQYSDNEYITDGDHSDSIHEVIPSNEETQNASSARSGHHRRSAHKQVEKIVMESIPPTNQQDSATAAESQEEVAEDSFDNRDTYRLFH